MGLGLGLRLSFGFESGRDLGMGLRLEDRLRGRWAIRIVEVKVFDPSESFGFESVPVRLFVTL